MNYIYLLWNQLNWLEYVTYVIIPVTIILVILIFIYFNLSILRTSLNISSEDKYKVLDFMFNEDYENTHKLNKAWK
jgi:hypothetical protein